MGLIDERRHSEWLSCKLANLWVLLANNHKWCWKAFLHTQILLTRRPCGRSKVKFTRTTLLQLSRKLPNTSRWFVIRNHLSGPDIDQFLPATKPLSTIVQPGRLLSSISVQPQPILRLFQPSGSLALSARGQILNRASFGTMTQPLNALMCVQNPARIYEISFIIQH